MNETEDLIHGVSMPESNKMLKIIDKSQLCGEFLEWLQQRYTLCTVDERGFCPGYVSVQNLLAEFFDIDLKKVDAEKAALLDAIRKETEDVYAERAGQSSGAAGQCLDG